MSTRAIAPIVGASRKTVDRDIRGGSNDPPEVVGLDGKTYPKPEPVKPKRRPLPDAVRTAGWDLRKAVERLVTKSLYSGVSAGHAPLSAGLTASE